MAPESPGNLVVIDLELRNSKLQCVVERFDPTSSGLKFLHVSWNAIDCPERFVALRSGTAYVWVPATFEHRCYRARVDGADEGCFEWLDRAFGTGMMLIMKLPPKYLYVFPKDPRPGCVPVRFKCTDDGRLAFYCWLTGIAGDGRIIFTWRMEYSEVVEIEAECKRLNDKARLQPDLGPGHADLPEEDRETPSALLPPIPEPPGWHVGTIGTMVVIGPAMDNRTNVTNTISNSPGAIANTAKELANVTNAVTQKLSDPAAQEEVKNLIKQLADQIVAISRLENTTTTKVMSDDLETLTKELARTEPRRAWYALSLKGIQEAARTVGEIGKPILDIVAKLGDLLH